MLEVDPTKVNWKQSSESEKCPQSVLKPLHTTAVSGERISVPIASLGPDRL